MAFFRHPRQARWRDQMPHHSNQAGDREEDWIDNPEGEADNRRALGGGGGDHRRRFRLRRGRRRRGIWKNWTRRGRMRR